MNQLGCSICLLVLPLLFSSSGQAATCGCAGVPLMSTIDTSSIQAGDLYLNLSTEVQEINDLVRGREEIKDATGRERSSAAQALSVNYGLSEHWAVSGLVSYIEHSRKVGSSFLGEQHSSGLGDGVILFRYTPKYITPFSRHEISLGFGARIPIGKDDDGGVIALSEDMQPSVGAPGKIFWTGYSYAFNQAATLLFNASANYTLNDEENDRKYTFGDEFNFYLGIGQNIGTKFSYSAGLRYRETSADQRSGFNIPNTGGKWLDFAPSVQYSISDDIHLSLSGRIPVDRKLDGALQFSTSYSYAMTLSYGL